MQTVCSKIKSSFTECEIVILHYLQEGLPICSRPFVAIAEKAGCNEEDVLKLVERLKLQKIIRRFGASINHRLTGFEHNALLAWNTEGMDDATIEVLGEAGARFNFVSHCYLRPSSSPEWPYSIYTMLHASSLEQLEKRIAELFDCLQNNTDYHLPKPLVLKTIEEYKKTSMTYF